VDRSITDPLAFVKQKMVGTMNLLNAAKTIWKDDLEGKRFTILARMRFMEALVLKDYLQTAYDPNSPYSAQSELRSLC
jgi:dTDP-glucose 4,6-dehydratase